MDYASEEIASYEWRPSIYYPSPARQVTPLFGPWGIPYKALGIEIQNTNFQHIEAPSRRKRALSRIQSMPFIQPVSTPSGKLRLPAFIPA